MRCDRFILAAARRPRVRRDRNARIESRETKEIRDCRRWNRARAAARQLAEVVSGAHIRRSR